MLRNLVKSCYNFVQTCSVLLNLVQSCSIVDIDPIPHINCAHVVEDAVNEVKRQAVAEMQKAVAAAEAKAAELITAERTKMDRTISEVRKQAHSEAVQTVGQQEDSSEVRHDRTRSAKVCLGTNCSVI